MKDLPTLPTPSCDTLFELSIGKEGRKSRKSGVANLSVFGKGKAIAHSGNELFYCIKDLLSQEIIEILSL